MAPRCRPRAHTGDKLRGVEIRHSADSTVDLLIPCVPAGHGETELSREQTRVAEGRMCIEWQMCGVQCQVRGEQSADASEMRSGQRLQSAPEETVMHQQ